MPLANVAVAIFVIAVSPIAYDYVDGGAYAALYA